MAICLARSQTMAGGHRPLSRSLEAMLVCLTVKVLPFLSMTDIFQLVFSVPLCRIPQMSWSASLTQIVHREKPLEQPWAASTRTSVLVASGTVS